MSHVLSIGTSSFFPGAGVPVLCLQHIAWSKKVIATVCARRKTSTQQLLTMEFPTKIKHRLYMDPLVGGSCWRFGMPGLKLILVDQSSNIQVEKKISCRSTITSTTIPVDDSIKLVPLPSVVRRIEWWQLPIAHCCFMSTFLRFRSALHSTQWQRRTCDLQAICMRFVFLWSTQPIHEMMALSAETNWPLRKPMPNGTQRPGSGPWSLNSNWVLAVFLWSSFLWKCTAKKNWLKPSNMSTQEQRPSLVAQQMTMPYPVRLKTSETPCLAERRRVVGGMGFNAWSFDMCFL